MQTTLHVPFGICMLGYHAEIKRLSAVVCQYDFICNMQLFVADEHMRCLDHGQDSALAKAADCQGLKSNSTLPVRPLFSLNAPCCCNWILSQVTRMVPFAPSEQLIGNVLLTGTGWPAGPFSNTLRQLQPAGLAMSRVIVVSVEVGLTSINTESGSPLLSWPCPPISPPQPDSMLKATRGSTE